MVAFNRRKLTSWEVTIDSDEECAFQNDLKIAHGKGEKTSRLAKHALSGKIDDRQVIFQRSNLFMIARMSLVIGFYFFITRRNYLLIDNVLKNISLLETDIEQMKRQSEDTKHELQIVHDNFKHLQRTSLSKSNLTFYEQTQPRPNWTRAVSDQVIEKHDGQESKIRDLKDSIRYYHYLELERRFGPGPYYIELKLIIKGTPRYMTLQTAPNHLLPHTLYVFMDMVDRKIWDNTILLHQWNHKLQAKRMPPNTASSVSADLPRSLELSLIEYSEEYPHEVFTIGLSGRLGSSEFFINMEDNDKIYGKREDRLEDAYPCFAKVVIGKSTLAFLNRATAEAMEEGSDGMLVTSIESMKIVHLSKERLKELGVIS